MQAELSSGPKGPGLNSDKCMLLSFLASLFNFLTATFCLSAFPGDARLRPSSAAGPAQARQKSGQRARAVITPRHRPVQSKIEGCTAFSTGLSDCRMIQFPNRACSKIVDKTAEGLSVLWPQVVLSLNPAVASSASFRPCRQSSVRIDTQRGGAVGGLGVTSRSERPCKSRRSTLADSHESRDWRLYDFAQVLIRVARPREVHDPMGADLGPR